MKILKFTENFLDLCKETNLNQVQLANEIGINQSQISRYFNGVLPDIETVVKICDYFNCSIDFIVGLNDKFSYNKMKKSFNNLAFYNEYTKFLKQKSISHFKLSKKKIVCETSLRFWKKGKLPKFEVLCNIAFELGGSIDKMLGRI